MNKFLNIAKKNKGNNVDFNNNMNINNNMNMGNGRIQGYITPSNNQEMNNNTDTFVYGSYNSSSGQMVSPPSNNANQNNGYINQNNNYVNNNQTMNNQQMMNQQVPNMTQNYTNNQNVIASNSNSTGVIVPGGNNYVNNSQQTIAPGQNYETSGFMEESEVLDLPVEESKPVKSELDPLNNANNPVPVNPVAPTKEVFVEDELPKDVKANIFSVIGMMLGMVLTPGSTIVTNSKKYRSTFKAFMVTVWITAVSVVLSIGVRILVGSFTKSYNTITGSSRINFNIANIMNLENYLPYVILAFFVSFIVIFIVSLIYYASSFLNSKGVPLGSYIMVSNLGLLPLIIGVIAVSPAISIISSYLGMLALIFSFLYSLIAFMTGMNEILTFKNIDRKILYNVLNLSCIILVVIVLYAFLVRMNILVLPEFNL